MDELINIYRVLREVSVPYFSYFRRKTFGNKRVLGGNVVCLYGIFYCLKIFKKNTNWGTLKLNTRYSHVKLQNIKRLPSFGKFWVMKTGWKCIFKQFCVSFSSISSRDEFVCNNASNACGCSASGAQHCCGIEYFLSSFCQVGYTLQRTFLILKTKFSRDPI